MLTIEFSAGDVARIRFALSCLWEAMSAFHVVQGPDGHTALLPWIRRNGPAMRAMLGEGSLLAGLIPSGPRYTPDFLTPPSFTLNPDIREELTRVLATPHEQVRAEIELLTVPRTPAVQAMYDDPDAGLRRFAREMTLLWDTFLAPEWPRMKAVLDAEVFHRARRFTEEGAEGLLNGLHEWIGWRDETLSVAREWCLSADIAAGSGVLLVPAVFVWPAVRTVASGVNPQIAYPPRGVATLWEAPHEAPDALAAVLGRTRAQLLVELDAPASTTELAKRVGVSAAGVSQHLKVLRDAGLVTPHRAGHKVLNLRTAAADTLLAAVPG
ncbi:transcriptional regulator [Actinorhabdospora filicis]|uniref:Transcriptional regulator n=1 Tax=Actinorhabdospora filicis TaxID=1785913 RepID=A0A9W6SPM4_9ACTN|nr:transcriptional regulator [Actinorhabdospora filicis]